MSEKLLRAGDVAEILGVNPREPYAMAKDGRLPAVRLSSRLLRFRRQDVERLITENLTIRSRKAQGLPAKVEDGPALQTVARTIGKAAAS